MSWKIEFDAAAAKEFRKLNRTVQQRIQRYLRERIMVAADPRQYGKAMRGEKAGLWRYRVGDYRLICAIEDDHFVVLVLKVGHRRDVYRS